MKPLISIGYLGPEGTFSWSAGKILFKESQLIPFPTIKEVFTAVANNKISLGVIPIENSIGGLVAQSVDSFLDMPVYSAGAFILPVNHCFASYGKDLKKIKIIKTHPQPLIQCKNWIELNLPNVIKESALSTIDPVFKDNSKETGFILSEQAAKKFKLNILAKNIQDDKNNFTKFLVISRSHKNLYPELVEGKRKTLLIFSIYDRIGILKDILNIFSENNINLSALHSIPAPNKPWDYLFFFELEANQSTSEFKKVLKELEKYCPFIKIIGNSN